MARALLPVLLLAGPLLAEGPATLEAADERLTRLAEEDRDKAKPERSGFWAWLEDKFVFPAERGLLQHASILKVPFEELSVDTPDGERLFAWYFPLSPSAPVVVYSHGNGGNISFRLGKVKAILEAGASVLIYDYRGYGRSTGKPSEHGTYLDGEAFLGWLVEQKKVPRERIVLYGESLGAAVAAELALRQRVGGLIMESGFTSLKEMAERSPIPGAKGNLTYKYDSITKMPRLSTRLLVMHGKDDAMIPMEMARRLFAAAPEPKTFVELQGGHDDNWRMSGEAYVGAIRSFVSTLAESRVEQPAPDGLVEGLGILDHAVSEDPEDGGMGPAGVVPQVVDSPR